MAIKRRRVKLSKARKTDPSEALLTRMGDILAAGHGTAADAETYYKFLYERRLRSIQSIVAKAEANLSWKHMVGSYKQAAEVFVLASVLYEKHPELMLMSDAAYDSLARWLLRNKRELPKSFLRWYAITTVDLTAGTGHKVQERTPIKWMVKLILEKEHVQNSTGILRNETGGDGGASSGSSRIKRRKPVRRKKKSKRVSRAKNSKKN